MALNASLVQRLSRTATFNAVSSSLGGNPDARAKVATCEHVVTNAGNVVVVVVVDGKTAGTTCGVGSGACALLKPKATESTKTRAIMPVVILWLSSKFICCGFPFGKGYPTCRTLGFYMPFARVGNQTF
jgi:hypothetical protein